MKKILNESKKLERIIDNSLVEADDNQIQRAKATVLGIIKNMKRDIQVPDMLYSDWVRLVNNVSGPNAIDSLITVIRGMNKYVSSEITKRERISDQMDDVLSSLVKYS